MIQSTSERSNHDTLLMAARQCKQGQLLEDELKIISFLEAYHPEMVADYVGFLVKGRQGILRRLVGSMLREDILGLTSNSYDLYVVGSVHALNVPAIDEYWQRVIEVFNTYSLGSGKVYKLFPLSNNECLVIPVSQTYAFNRIEVEGEILYIYGSEVRTVDHAVEILELMRRKEEAHLKKDHTAWVKLARELINGSANLALSYTHWERRKKELKQKAYDTKTASVIEWVVLQKKQDPTFDSSLFFEQLSIEGHNLHPGAKTKIGMEPSDVFNYAPEFEGCTNIQFLGIRKDYAEWGVLKEDEEDPNGFLFKEYSDLPKIIEREFADYGLCIKDYVFVPVHSWQLEHTIPELYQQEIRDHIVVPIRGKEVPSGATSSFRTVVPLTKKPKCAIKVAVNSQMTSTVRSISPNTTNNAAIFTRLIKQIMQEESTLRETFVPICECAGFNFKSKETEGPYEINQLKNRNLSAVFRENVETFVAVDELAIVGSSLFSESPLTEKPVVVELIEKFAIESKEASLRKAAFQFFSEYMFIALPGFLTLMTKYGIGLEGHLQNSVVVFKGGRPVRLLFRDWGGARIYKGRLKQHHVHVEFYPGSVTMTDNLEEMHNKVFYTVFQNQCGELILQLCKHFGLRERDLWQEVHRICKDVFNHLESLPSYTKNVQVDKTALYKETVNHKALTKMRLEPEEKGYSYANVPNPLYQYGRKEGELWHK